MNRTDLSNNIREITQKGFSVHLDSLPGLGLSHFLRQLCLAHSTIYLDGLDQNLTFPQIDTYPITVIIDHFEHLLQTKDPAFFNQLRVIRDQHKYQLTYILATSHIESLSDHLEKLDHFFEIASENHLILPPADETETNDIIDTISRRLNRKVNQEERETIFRYSHGIPSLIKTYLLQNDSGAINQDRVTGTILALTKNILPPPSNLTFTRTQQLLMDHLSSNLNKICSRSNLITAGWPDEDDSGVSDQALDQNISRLRKKITFHNFKIETIKGRGFRLIDESNEQ
jgi:hypothetical protein